MHIILLALILISLIFAPLGCIVLWKRYSYFGDGISHASLLAGSIALTTGLPIVFSIPLAAIAFALLISIFKNNSDTNSTVGLISSLMLSTAIVISTLSPSSVNIEHLLFGDIISVTYTNILVLMAIISVNSLFISLQYRNILLETLSKDIAVIHNVKVRTLDFLFLLILSITICSTVKIVGALMVVSLLIIPPMIAGLFSKSPLQMIILAVIISLATNLIGIFLSFYLDFPPAPTIVILGAVTYILAYLLMRARNF